jgi:hypothetical protein
MMSNTEIIHNYLKKEHGASLETMAKDINMSKDYIAGLIDSQIDKYSIVDGTIALKSLGNTLCVVCSESKDPHCVSIYLPKDLLTGKILDATLKEEIRGHEKCYESIGLVFREKNMLKCYDCSSFTGQWIDGDEVLEKCYKLHYEKSGHRGVLASDSMCNHFSPDNDLKTNPKFAEHKKCWEDIKPAIEQKTLQGYKNLIAILEKAKLLK